MKNIKQDAIRGRSHRSAPLARSLEVRDRFANYVVQRLLDVAAPDQKEEVFWILKDQVRAGPRTREVGLFAFFFTGCVECGLVFQ